MDLEATITAFFSDMAGQAAMALLAVGLLDFLLGIFAAIRDKVFEWTALDAWLRSNLAGRILPLWALLIFGYLSNSIQFAGLPLVTAGALAATAAYVASTLASILEKWGPGNMRKVQDVPTE